MPTDTAIDPALIFPALSRVNDEATFIQALLAETLNWPIPDKGVSEVDDITYDWPKDDRKAPNVEKKLVGGRVLEVNLTGPSQHWGIFVLEFNNPGVFDTDRGMTGVLREVLRWLVPRRRDKTGDKRSWNRDHLLFICTHDYSQFRFAYFKDPIKEAGQPRLAAFGWQAGSTEVRTVCEFNLSHLGWPDDPANKEAWAVQWAAAFDVEKVTKRFYTEYRDEFESLRKKVKGLGTDTEDQKMFTQTLLNRLMFLRFIERKGWLRAPGESKSNDYLRLLFEAGDYRGKSFYCGRLRKLFFEGLAIEGKQESEAIGKVPFLNGGLFEESTLDEKVDDVPDKAFEPLLGPSGLFYRYNFTVQESTPLNVEVAVDPEMLGKVFEELVTGRHESGSYYTPRPVVSYMCREALKGYLAEAAKLDEIKVADFVDRHETPFGIDDAKKIAAALDDIKAVDPACGSGAYLLGLLHEMVDLYQLLYSNKLKNDDREIHKIKLNIIEKSLYGVDVDPFATNIAMLRLWLSLSVDSAKPQSLPNLDFKIETGDSLTGPDPQQFSDLLLHEPARQLAIIKGKYMRARGEEKKSLKRLIDKEQREIAFKLRSLCPGAIDWRVQFCEIFFSDRGGFDVVLANPPYIRQELIKDLKPALKKVYKDEYSGTADLYVFFYLRALQLLAQGGMLVFISSNKWFRATYGEVLRAAISKQCDVLGITDFESLPVFESATAYPMIFVAQKRQAGRATIFTVPPSLDAPYPDILAVIRTYGSRLPTDALRGANWRLMDDSSAGRLDKMRESGTPLVDYVRGRLYFGIKTCFNKAYVLSRAERDQLIEEDPKTREILKPLVLGRDVNRWSTDDSDRWLLLSKIGVDIDRYPAAFKHLSRYRRELENREDQGNHWWELRTCAYYDAFDGEKIMWGNMGLTPRFTLAGKGVYTVAPANVIALRDLYLLGVLNSATASAFFSAVNIQRGGQYLEFKPMYVKQLPVPNAPTSDRSAVAALVQKCLDAKGIDCEAWEKEIDERVAALYGL